MDRGHLDLVLDLAEVDFMGAQGIRVLAAVRLVTPNQALLDEIGRGPRRRVQL